jgi:hypothetical protein
MPSDIRQLLRDAAAAPSAPLEVGAVVERAGRVHRQRIRTALVAVAVIIAVTGIGIWSAQGRSPTTRLHTVNPPAPRSAGFTVTIPPGWQRAGQVLSGLTDPHEILAAGTFPMHPPATYSPACDNQLPTTIVDAMGPGDAFVWLLERNGRDVGAPARPVHFNDGTVLRLNDCGPPLARRHQRLYWGSFHDGGRDFYAAVLLGPDVSSTRRAEAYAILDSLRFAPRTALPEVDALLAWVDASLGLVLGDPVTGDSTIVGPQGNWCATCSLVADGGGAVAAEHGTIYRFDVSRRGWHSLGPGDAVFASPFIGEIYVAVNGQLELRSLDGRRTAGPWTVPGGYTAGVFQAPRAVNNGVLIESSDRSAAERRLALWDPPTGRVQPLGSVWQLIDTHFSAANAPSTIARVDCAQPGQPKLCVLLLTNSVTGETRQVSSPVAGSGFIFGGAFSPDGTRLAAFVSATQGGGNAQLVIVDVNTGRVQRVGNATVGIGEAYGYATWSRSGDWVVFGGYPGYMNAYRLGSGAASQLPFPTNYSVVALPRG